VKFSVKKARALDNSPGCGGALSGLRAGRHHRRAAARAAPRLAAPLPETRFAAHHQGMRPTTRQAWRLKGVARTSQRGIRDGGAV